MRRYVVWNLSLMYFCFSPCLYCLVQHWLELLPLQPQDSNQRLRDILDILLIYLLHALFGTINLPPLIPSIVGSVSPINRLQEGIFGVFLLAARNLSWIISWSNFRTRDSILSSLTAQLLVTHCLVSLTLSEGIILIVISVPWIKNFTLFLNNQLYMLWNLYIVKTSLWTTCFKELS